MNNFTKCLIKGDAGEVIIDNLLKEMGYYVYSPPDGKNHPIDRLCLKSYEVNAYDVKTKPRRNDYRDSGYDYIDHCKYIKVNDSVKVSIFFVDTLTKSIYWAKLDDLLDISESFDYPRRKVTYPSREWAYNHETGCKVEVIYFPLSAFRTIRSLTEDEIEAINGLPEKLKEAKK